MKIEELKSILEKVIKDKVFYGINVYDNEDNASMPYIVFQETSKRPIGYADNKSMPYMVSIQITLVTKNKSPILERTLEKTLLDNNLNYSLVSEFFNSDKSINRVYEIKTEE